MIRQVTKCLPGSRLKWRIAFGFLTRVTELIVFALFFHDEIVSHQGSIDHLWLFLSSYVGLGLMFMAYFVKFVLEVALPLRPTPTFAFALQIVVWIAVCVAATAITAFFVLAVVNSRTQRSASNEAQIAGVYLKLWAFIVLAASKWTKLPTLESHSAFVFIEFDLERHHGLLRGDSPQGLLDEMAAEDNRRDNFFGDDDEDIDNNNNNVVTTSTGATMDAR
jgi:hypothetical protein